MSGGAQGRDVTRADMRETHREHFAQVVSPSASGGQAACGVRRVPRREPEIRRRGSGGHYLANLHRCGSVWSCPCCAGRVQASRGQELEEAIRSHREDGGVALFLTGTIPHHPGHSLEELVQGLQGRSYDDDGRNLVGVWPYLKRGAPWQRWADRLDYQGEVVAWDATHGDNGWHPHKHAVWFVGDLDERAAELEVGKPGRGGGTLEGPEALEHLVRETGLDPDAWARELHDSSQATAMDLSPGEALLGCLVAWLRDRWERRIRSYYTDGDGRLRSWPLNRRKPAGFSPRFRDPHPVHGLQVKIAHQGAGAYVSRMGLGRETSHMDAKSSDQGRTPMEILADLTRADQRGELKPGGKDARLWLEWSRTMKGRRHLYWSPGLRDQLLEDPEERDDQERAQEQDVEDDELVVVLGTELWRRLVSLVGGHVEGTLTRMLDGGADLEELRAFCSRAVGDGGVVRLYESERRLVYRQTWRAAA